MRKLWNQIEGLDNKVSAKIQTQMHLTILQTLRHAIYWFLTEIDKPNNLAPVIATYSKGIEHLAGWLHKGPTDVGGHYQKIENELTAQGVPPGLARRVAMMPVLGTALDLTRLAAESNNEMDAVANMFFGLGQRLGFDWLGERGLSFVADTPWQREAIAVILDDLAATQRRLTAKVLGKDKRKSASHKLTEWLYTMASRLERYDALIAEWRSVGAVDVAMLTLASRQLAALVA
jgi:glutamate dehydrogenase